MLEIKRKLIGPHYDYRYLINNVSVGVRSLLSTSWCKENSELTIELKKLYKEVLEIPFSTYSFDIINEENNRRALEIGNRAYQLVKFYY